MLTENNILDAINARLCERFPERMVYVNVQPQEFKRPSFFIRSGDKNAEPATRTTMVRTETYYITVFEAVDERGICDLTQLSAVQAQVAALFFHPFPCVDVLDQETRWLTATPTAQALSELDSALIALKVRFHDDVINGLIEPIYPEPLMRTVRMTETNNEYSEVITDGSSDS
ncbi:MAG: hypothetical protein IKZ82_10890 [Clostridia bacterium]|nr:hypothetical protein [Clostridia bacterium]